MHTTNLIRATRGSPLVIGIGSPHGDDRAGWEVIDHLENRVSKPTERPLLLYKAAVPHDILDWLHRDVQLHIIDACSSVDRSVARFEIVQDESSGLQVRSTTATSVSQASIVLKYLRSNSSHQFDLLSTLQLAAVLGSLPPRIVLWTIPMITTEKTADLSPQSLEYIAVCAVRIRQELCHA
ncbi:MAG: hydrogenase maturation protease [Pirellulaceae bacterium]